MCDAARASGGIFTGSTTMINGGRDPIMITPGAATVACRYTAFPNNHFLFRCGAIVLLADRYLQAVATMLRYL